MAVVLIEEPGAVVFSKNPVMFGFKSDARYSNAGRVSIGRININSLGSAGQTFSLTYGGRKLTFSISNVPDDSGLQLPAPIGGETVDAWAGRIRVALGKNYYIQRDFSVGSTAGNNIVLTSKEKSAEYNISFEQSGSNLSFSVLQSGITRTLQPNFKLLCELYVKNSTGEFVRQVSSALETDDDGNAYWDISKQLTSSLLVDGADRPNMSVSAWEKSTKVIREFYITYAEMYGTVQKVRVLNTSTIRVGVLGGFSKVMMAERAFPSFFIRDGQNKWMSNLEGGRVIKREQPFFNSIVNFISDYSNVEAKVKVSYSDNSQVTQTIKNVGTWRKFEKLICPMGVLQNSLHLIDETKVIVQYEVWLESGGVAVSEMQQIAIDYKYEPYLRFLVFENSLGCYDTFYCYGKKSTGYDIVQKKAKLVRNVPFKLEDGEDISFAINLTNEETINSGYMPKRAIRSFRDFFLANEKFVYKNNRYYPVLLNTETIKEFEDGNNLHALEFGLVSAFNEDLWSDDEIEEMHAYVPDLSGYIPQPPMVPENFDDRYYLKTLTYNRTEIDNKLNNLKAHVDQEISTVQEEQAELRLLLANKAEWDHTHPDYVTLGELSDMISDLSLWAGVWSEQGVDDDGYDGDVYVIYQNCIYKSLVPDNKDIPGVDPSWQLVLQGGNQLVIDNDASYQDTSESMNLGYPDMRVGGAVWSLTNGVKWTKVTPTQWSVLNIVFK